VNLGSREKCSNAASTVMSSDSFTFTPRTRTSSTSGLNREPPHTSHGTIRSARKYISTCTQPAPSQWSQRPPAALNENAPSFKPRAIAAGCLANTSRSAA